MVVKFVEKTEEKGMFAARKVKEVPFEEWRIPVECLPESSLRKSQEVVDEVRNQLRTALSEILQSVRDTKHLPLSLAAVSFKVRHFPAFLLALHGSSISASLYLPPICCLPLRYALSSLRWLRYSSLCSHEQ